MMRNGIPGITFLTTYRKLDGNSSGSFNKPIWNWQDDTNIDWQVVNFIDVPKDINYLFTHEKFVFYVYLGEFTDKLIIL